MTKPKTTTTEKKFECPECHEKFGRAQVLGAHRRSAHGIAGTSPAVLAMRRLKLRQAEKRLPVPAPIPADPNAELSDYMRIKKHLKEMKAPEHPAPFQCPLCGYHTKNKAGLSLHVNRFHPQPDETLQCPHCNFVGKNIGGLNLHRHNQHNENLAKRKHPERSKYIEPAQAQTITLTTASTHHEEEAHFAANGIPEATLALALGRFQGLCSSMATEFDLPPRNFASRLAELIYRSQVR